MAVYEGKNVHTVTRDGRRFSHRPSLKVINHSPTGFSWGYAGSGPAQLALALLLDATGGHKGKAMFWHQPFKFAFVAHWEDGWRMTSEEILDWIGRVEQAEEHADDAAFA